MLSYFLRHLYKETINSYKMYILISIFSINRVVGIILIYSHAYRLDNVSYKFVSEIMFNLSA